MNSDIESLIQFFDEIPASPRFTRRAVNIPGDFRTAWRLSVLTMLLARGRANALAIDHLHVLWWAIRTPKTRELFLRWLQGDKGPDELLVRFDPSLTVTVDLAIGEGLVAKETSANIRLTAAGEALAAEAESDENVLRVEKTFLESLPRRITQRQIRKLLEWT
ncbi:hypothetical protein [Mycetocola spongiae]|uniref:hypothetical protein n=1 Tax=Mycetocola spongiae TaxID=2859226 RepID=UPI001CF35F8D|nr:hypothetical protein [Mycetocola spongiae]UCR89931.1 hypothetical protein KXZ72_04475 [Mycetocola spongiae]